MSGEEKCQLSASANEETDDSPPDANIPNNTSNAEDKAVQRAATMYK